MCIAGTSKSVTLLIFAALCWNFADSCAYALHFESGLIAVRAQLVFLAMSSTKVVPSVDPAAVEYNKRIVLAATITVLVLSNTSFILRLIARRMQHQRLQADDYFMGLALPFSKSDLATLL